METNDCEQALLALYHFLDGELTADRRRSIELHLDDCLHCHGAFEFEFELRTVVQAKAQDNVPDHLRQRVLRALSQEGGPLLGWA
ncbi:MAG: mycothiol system anti-sigma-R factor [Acidimicrobiales bacterium]